MDKYVHISIYVCVLVEFLVGGCEVRFAFSRGSFSLFKFFLILEKVLKIWFISAPSVVSLSFHPVQLDSFLAFDFVAIPNNVFVDILLGSQRYRERIICESKGLFVVLWACENCVRFTIVSS